MFDWFFKTKPITDEEMALKRERILSRHPSLVCQYEKIIRDIGASRKADERIVLLEKELKTNNFEIWKNEETAADKKAAADEVKKREERLASKDNAVQCPYCKSWDTEKISTASRVASVAMVGVASGKIGKNFHCNKCGANF